MLRACPHHGFTELTQIDTFYNGLNDNDQDSLNAAAGGNLLIEIVSKKVVTPATVKAVEEYCVTCGSAHAWYNCSNTDNNQSSVCAATCAYNQVIPPNRVSNYMAPLGFTLVQNNGQNRYNQNQGQGNNFNRGNNFHGNQGFQVSNNHAPNFQNQGFQNQPFQLPNNQSTRSSKWSFSNYMKSNDQMMRNMQSQINSLKGEFKNEIQNTMKTQQTVLMNQQNAFQNMLSGFFQNQASTAGTLPSNTIPNPKGEIKAITTQSGVAYEGPSIPTNPSPKKVVERETEETTDKEQTNFQGSTAHVRPPVNPIPILEPDVPKTLPKPNIPYQKHANESIKMINFIDVSCEDSFGEVLRLKKSNHFSSGSTTPLSNSRPSLTSFETSDSLLEKFADELALLDPFPPGNEDFDFEADLREFELLLNHDPSTDFSPTITNDLNPERFSDTPLNLLTSPER
ncbi:hypothetical protein Tco_1144569 [Tanacetum coccineum]